MLGAASARNVLYIVFDDLRPDISAYDVSFMHTPHMQKLADTGTLFERAYCQEAVCSPSRNSFATGRYPSTTRVWNFINNFREAECPDLSNHKHIVGTPLRSVRATKYAKCCEACVEAGSQCVGWSFNSTGSSSPTGGVVNSTCQLFSAVKSYEDCPTGQPEESKFACVSGSRGAFAQWTPLPAHFKNNGYLVLGGGKYYHPNSPPKADRDLSWTAAGPNGTIQFPDQREYHAKWGRFHNGGEFAPYGNFQYLNPDDEACGRGGPEDGPYNDFCNPDWPADGTPPMPPAKDQIALGDFVTYNDAITKLRFAADNLKASGQPFFQIMGIKRPHLGWRAPLAYLEKYPIESVAAPSQMALDKSIDPVAYTVFPMSAPNCTVTGTEEQAGPARQLAADGSYTKHTGMNCFNNHGGVNIDSSDNVTTKTLSDCTDFCDETVNCFCVVTTATDNKPDLCYRRAACDPSRCSNSSQTENTYIKPGAQPVPSPACPNFVKDPYHPGSDAQVRILRQHYYAAVSWADFVAGKILDELEALKLENDTMVVLHSDHGWHLGEYAMWEKRTNWELGVRVPLMMRVPWMKSSVGKRSRALVELVDIYKTVVEVMGLPLPDDTHPVEGESLVPVLADPEHAAVKAAALSTFPRCAHVGMPVYGARGNGGADNTCLGIERTEFTWMGYTMRTDRWRYTEWVSWNGTTLSPCVDGSGISGEPCTWGKLKAAELYDHAEDVKAWTDADRFENVNLVKATDPAIVAALSRQLHMAFGFPDAGSGQWQVV